MEADKIREALAQGDNADEMFHIIAAAVNLERLLYQREDTISALFRLRKSLEAVFGQSLPKVDDWGDDLKKDEPLPEGGE